MRSLLHLVNLFFTIMLNGQQLYTEFGLTSSNFQYTNSSGANLENIWSKSDIFFRMGYRGQLNQNETLFFSLGGIYIGYGAIGSDPLLDNFFEWDTSYLGIEGGVDFRLLRLRDFSFYAKASAAYEFLLRGNQTINNQVFNLVGEEEFNSSHLFIRGGLMMTYPISRKAVFSAAYYYGGSMLANGGNPNDLESLSFTAHHFGFGIIIQLPNCNCNY
jgi:hypothetical protein